MRGRDRRPVEKRRMPRVNGRIARQLAACGLVAAALSGLSRPAGAVEEDTVGWWIYAGSIRSTLLTRFIGPEGSTPAGAAIAYQLCMSIPASGSSSFMPGTSRSSGT